MTGWAKFDREKYNYKPKIHEYLVEMRGKFQYSDQPSPDNFQKEMHLYGISPWEAIRSNKEDFEEELYSKDGLHLPVIEDSLEIRITKLSA